MLSLGELLVSLTVYSFHIFSNSRGPVQNLLTRGITINRWPTSNFYPAFVVIVGFT